jgi:hypothetical protein
LQALQPDTVETRLLHFLVERRRQVVDEKTRQNNRLIDCLKLYFPQILHWFDDVTSPLVGALLQRWPTLQDLKRSHPGTLRKFFHQHNCRSEKLIEERIAAIYQAIPATDDGAVLEAGAITARGLVALLTALRANIAELDERIGQVVASHPDAAIFNPLPGAGAALVPHLIVAFGTRRERFHGVRTAMLQRDIARARSERQIPMGTFPVDLPQISACQEVRGEFRVGRIRVFHLNHLLNEESHRGLDHRVIDAGAAPRPRRRSLAQLTEKPCLQSRCGPNHTLRNGDQVRRQRTG